MVHLSSYTLAIALLLRQGVAAQDAPTDPVTDAPVVADPSSVNLGAAPNMAFCTRDVSEGDVAAGVGVVTDLSCQYGGLGCVDRICRLCKIEETDKSKHLLDCIQVIANAPPALDQQTDPADDPANSLCALKPSDGDRAVGITIVADATCRWGGLGCINDDCRFCKRTETPQSAHLMTCDGGSKTESPSAPALPVGISTSPCSDLVSIGDRAVGVWAVSDASCAGGGLGCFADTCRFCRVQSTPQSAHFLDCTAFTVAPAAAQDLSQPPDASATPASTATETMAPEPTTPEPTTPKATTPEPTTPEPTTPEPTTPEPASSEAATPEAVTTAPSEPEGTAPAVPTTVTPVYLMSTQTGETTAVAGIAERSESSWKTSIGIGCGSVAAVALLAFAAHRQRQRHDDTPVTPNVMAQPRGSVFNL
ncbi:hypothetical protein PINS_up011296 [Pythium insidiosum]|nr:hypothetical protein PINS_up011296 [Pythium insidiosum]